MVAGLQQNTAECLRNKPSGDVDTLTAAIFRSEMFHILRPEGDFLLLSARGGTLRLAGARSGQGSSRRHQKCIQGTSV
jgi:hypothetical protein